MNTLLPVVRAALASFPAPTPQKFQSGVWGAMPREADVTRALAIELARRMPSVWTAVASHRHLAAPRKVDSWKSLFFYELAELDLAWSTQALGPPEHFLEVKVRSSAAASQDHYLFMSDLVSLAGEHVAGNAPGTFTALFVLPKDELTRTPWLSCLAPTNGRMHVKLDPSSATQSLPGGQDPYWSNPNLGTYEPRHRGAMCKLFTGTTGAKLSGFFGRPGVLEVECIVAAEVLANDVAFIAYRLDTATLTGAKLSEWWP